MRPATALSFLFLLCLASCGEDAIDDDGDGYTLEDDCDDGDAAIHPGADEVCDGADNDCDGLTDDEDDVSDPTEWFLDEDGDGHGVGEAVMACVAPEGSYADVMGDCNDADERYYDGAPEEDCEDPNDYNCDGSVGYADVDEDGYPACKDCNDEEATANIDAPEICDGIDNDCDELVDDDDDSITDQERWFPDTDEDGYGDMSQSEKTCDPQDGWITTGRDCDDSSDTIHPDADEVCDNVDNDCDGFIDDDDDSVTNRDLWYVDADEDGYGDENDAGTEACEQPKGLVDNLLDCDDTNELFAPGAFDWGDEEDNDCDGSTDEDVGSETYDSADIQTIVSAKCKSCHTTNSYGNLNMNSFFDSTVNVASDDVSSMDLIEPGDPSSSYLWHKIEGTQGTVGGTGKTMPTSGSLTSAQTTTIETWILEGAVE